MNNVAIIGNLTRDPELRYTPSGAAVCDIGVAINEKEKRGGEWVDVAHFVDVTAWAGQAEAVSTHLNQGDKVGVTGSLCYQAWEDKNGARRSKLKVTAKKVDFLGKANRNRGGGREPVGAASIGGPDYDDVPF